ncbi:hypothetical protein GCM10023201_48340 [Actinomycetospora corticicola]
MHVALSGSVFVVVSIVAPSRAERAPDVTTGEASGRTYSRPSRSGHAAEPGQAARSCSRWTIYPHREHDDGRRPRESVTRDLRGRRATARP